VRYASLTHRIRGAGADAWAVHDLAMRRAERGDDVIVLSIGESDIDTPPAIVDTGVGGG
jgi:arginine:pyruvate transaminase